MKPSLALLVGGLLCQLPFGHAGAADADPAGDPPRATARVAAAPAAGEPAGARSQDARASADPRPPATTPAAPGRPSADTGLVLAGLALMVGIALRGPGR